MISVNSEFIQVRVTEQNLAERHFGQTLPLRMQPDGEPKYVLGPHCI